MKKILALAMTVLMLLPMLASAAFAAITIPDGVEVVNVANKATVAAVDSFNQNVVVDEEGIVPGALVDGDRTIGTKSPMGTYYSYELKYENPYYFTDVIVVCNGKGTLATGEVIKKDTFNVGGIIVKVYYGNELVFESEPYDVWNEKDITVSVDVKGDRIEVVHADGEGGRDDYMWEIETYAPDMEMCSAMVENVASEATFSATGANANSWWALDFKYWVDGDPLTGSHSPKGRNYSVWMHFEQEYLFSQIDLVCNTEGGAKLASGHSVDDRRFGNSLMRVLVYNYNEDLVWDSDMVDTSTTTTLSVSPYVEGAIIEIRFFNGDFSGGEYMYEVSAYAQSGDHVFTQTAEENPGCLTPGFRELSCQCGKVIKQEIPATGFHKWEKEEIRKVPTSTENGVLAIGCTGCDSAKLYDIPSTGHNWVESKKYVAKYCDEQGYIEYKCKDAGCALTYKEITSEATSHEWGDGVITKKPSVTEEGVITYTCNLCGGTTEGRIRKHKFTDNIAQVTKDSVVSITEYTKTEFSAMDESLVFDGKTSTTWYGTAGSYIDIKFDRVYYFVSGKFFASSNYTFMKVEFLIENPNFNSKKAESDENPRYIVNATYNPGAIDNGSDVFSPKEFDMYGTLSAAVPATVVRITTLDPKWANGSASHVHEIELYAHACAITEDDYIKDDNNYKAPVCGTNGSCNAKCQVCEVVSKVVIPASANSHEYGEVIPDTPATCLKSGEGHAECKNCYGKIYGITIPATGKHDYTKEVTSVSAKCGFSGVKNYVCKYCDKIGRIEEIPPTGIHEYEWTTKSYASYTAVGKTEYCCMFCDQLDPNTTTNVEVAQKLPIPEGLVQFVGKTAGVKNGRNTLSFTYKIDLSLLPELEKTCDVRIITTIKDAQGREASIESYGKYATNTYNAETGEFTVTIYPSSTSDAFEVTTVARLMNFRGIVYKTYATGTFTSK